MNAQNNYIEYMNGGGSDPLTAAQNSLALFLNGGTGADGKSYPKVDLSLYDQATMCGTCHVGGPFYEQDRQGNRLPARLFMDWADAMTETGPPKINPLTTTVWEKYDPTTGAQISFPTFAPWAYPQFVGNDPSKGPVMATYGWVPQDMEMADPNTGAVMQLKQRQLMMPNVKEMDCLFCHLKGYDNVMASVMTQAGSLNMGPTVGAGLMDMFPLSPTYQGYNGQAVTFGTAVNGMQTVSLSDATVARIKGKPDSDNCHQCHTTKTLKDFPEMFGVTGNSTGFLSSAPMVYDPPGMGPLGKRMVAYDINSPFLFSGSSPVMDGGNLGMMTGLSYLQAMGLASTPTAPLPATPFTTVTRSSSYLGGGNMAQTGPLYYYNTAGQADQNTLKLSAMPFPRAEWFKRGDAWQVGQDVHGAFGCAGCHFTGDTIGDKKNQCDPGRGFDMMSGIQDGVPPLKNRNLVTEDQGEGTPTLQTPDKHDTRNTVKRCEFCHITGKDYYGTTINTFGAPNPDNRHAEYGLTANIVQIVDKVSLHGTFGGQGVPATTDAATLKANSGLGNHLDVMDCTVCHVKKESMVVRTLDATSGMRFPSIVGTDPTKGMMGLFEDVAPDSFNNYYAQQYNQMYQALGMGAPFAPDANGQYVGADGYPVVGGKLQAWKPLMVWQKLGNLELPLTTNLGTGANFSNSGNSQMNFRRKIYLSNPIVAAIWNNTDSNVDANGDGATGGIMNNSKPSLAGYRDIFSGDLLDKNNAQGFGEPIFDPWIMRDLKAGFNFGPGPLSVISVGFGNNNAYDPSGNGKFATNNYWKYASVWSGAVVFTEPYQIADYKAFRGPSWAGAELALVGDPFMVTHGAKAVSVYVKGKSCADCHAPGAGFFNGDYTMTGTAIPAERTYNPTAMLQTTMADATHGAWTVDGNTYLPVLDANGDPIRNPGAPQFTAESNMMQRPLEPYRVKGKKGDLRTNFEGFNKLGQPRTSEFQHEVTVDGEEYVHTIPLKRADALYPHEHNADGSELKIYCKKDDDCAANPALLMNGQEFANYLESAYVANKDNFGIGETFVADIATVNGAAASEGTSVVTVTKGAAAALVAANAGATGSYSYSWAVNDGSTVNPVTGATIPSPIASLQTSSYNFPKTGIFNLTLTVTNSAGKSTYATQKVSVVEPQPVTFTVGVISTTGGVTTVPVTDVVGTYAKYVVSWGDGSPSKTVTGAALSDLTHKYLRFSKYLNTAQTQRAYNTSIKFYDGADKVVFTKNIAVTVPNP